MRLSPNKAILNGKYHIIRLIGEGGMARVWLAEELTFGDRQVAIKEPRDDLLPHLRAEVAERYQREVEVCAALEQAHVPNMVRAITAEPYGESLLLVMEYMPGGDLADLLREHPQGLPIDRAVEIGRCVLVALDGAHQHAMEIVHRDVKPSNILFDGEGVAHLADFGLSQLPGLSGRSRLTGAAHPGTPLYMAPEQGTAVTYVTPAADLYALGCVLFEMLTGKRYKRHRPGTSVRSFREEVAEWLEAALVKALEEDPWDRWQSARDMVDALKMQASQEKREVAEAARSLVVCPMCGRRNQEQDVFDCPGPCGRKNLCLGHFDQEHNLCRECAEAARREAKERERRERARREAEEANPRGRELTLTLAPGVEIELVRVPAGGFAMGSAADDGDDYVYEKPQHRVYLDEFLMGRYPMTVDQYRAFVGATGHQGDDDALCGPGDHPVVRVSWEDAWAFCRWASEVTGRVVRLPTEAEWEKAARGTDGRRYPWGDEEPDPSRCNYDENVGNTTRVGRYSPRGDSPCGCADMAGNVHEWVNDYYYEYYYGRSPSSNPPGPSSGAARVVRGGSFDSSAWSVHAAVRLGLIPDCGYDGIGFRVCASPI